MGRIEKRIFFGVLLVLLSALGAMLFQNAFGCPSCWMERARTTGRAFVGG